MHMIQGQKGTASRVMQAAGQALDLMMAIATCMCPRVRASFKA